jgi:hypothetical protein
MLFAFHGNPYIKNFYLDRVRTHRKHNAIIQGRHAWRDGRGGAVGCTILSDNHFAYERLLRIPALLVFLMDAIFENLPPEKAVTWPEEFLAAINVNANLTSVWALFVEWLLGDLVNNGGLTSPMTQAAAQQVAILYRDRCTDLSIWAQAEVKSRTRCPVASWAAKAVEKPHAAFSTVDCAIAAKRWMAIKTGPAESANAAGLAAAMAQSEKLLELLKAASGSTS